MVEGLHFIELKQRALFPQTSVWAWLACAVLQTVTSSLEMFSLDLGLGQTQLVYLPG